MRRESKRLVIFFFLLGAISAVVQVPVIRAGDPHAAGAAGIFLIMWAPGLAALVAKLAVDRNLKGLGWCPGRARFLLSAYLIPPVIAGLVYCSAWISGIAGLDTEGYGALIANEFSLSDPLSIVAAIALLSIVGFLANSIVVLGEEIGWRGFLVPELAERMGNTKASLLVGLIWAVWHYPGIIWAGYNSGGPLVYSLVCFTIMIVGISLIAGYLRLRSGSLWGCVVLHASHNLWVQAVFDPLTTDDQTSRLLTTEWGAGLAIGYLVAALALLAHGRKGRRSPVSPDSLR